MDLTFRRRLADCDPVILCREAETTGVIFCETLLRWAGDASLGLKPGDRYLTDLMGVSTEVLRLDSDAEFVTPLPKRSDKLFLTPAVDAEMVGEPEPR